MIEIKRCAPRRARAGAGVRPARVPRPGAGLGQLPLPALGGAREWGSRPAQGRLGPRPRLAEGGSACRSTSRFSPSFAMGVIAIPAGGEIKAEAGAMTEHVGRRRDRDQGARRRDGRPEAVGARRRELLHQHVPRAAGRRAHRRARPCRATSSTCRVDGSTPDDGAVRLVARVGDRRRGRHEVGRREDVLLGRGSLPAPLHRRRRHARVELRRDRAASARRRRGPQDRHWPHRRLQRGHRIRGQQGRGLEVHAALGRGAGGRRSPAPAPCGSRRGAPPTSSAG